MGNADVTAFGSTVGFVKALQTAFVRVMCWIFGLRSILCFTFATFCVLLSEVISPV